MGICNVQQLLVSVSAYILYLPCGISRNHEIYTISTMEKYGFHLRYSYLTSDPLYTADKFMSNF